MNPPQCYINDKKSFSRTLPIKILLLLFITLVIATTTTTFFISAATINPLLPLYIPLINTVSDLSIDNTEGLRPGQIFGASFKANFPQQTKNLLISQEHYNAALIIFEILTLKSSSTDSPSSEEINFDNYDRYLVGSVNGDQAKGTFTVPKDIPEGTHTFLASYVHDQSISTTTPITITRQCPMCSGTGQQCNVTTGQCECNTDEFWVRDNSVSASLSCIPRCQTLSCQNGSTCNPTIARDVCTCSTTTTVGPTGSEVTVKFIGETCSAVDNSGNPKLPTSTNCRKNCGNDGYQLFDLSTSTCKDDCLCTDDRWVKHPVLNVCVTCYLQSYQVCDATHTDTVATYEQCDKCLCHDGYTGTDCSYPKYYFSAYIGDYSFKSFNPSTTPTTNNTNVFSILQKQPLKNLATLSTEPLLNEQQIALFINIVSTALKVEQNLITIENNILDSSRFIFSIGAKFASETATSVIDTQAVLEQQLTEQQGQFKQLLINNNDNNNNNDDNNSFTPLITTTSSSTNDIQSISELNLRWLQFRKQLSLGFAGQYNQIWDQFGPSFLFDTMYDPKSCPSYTTLQSTIATMANATKTITPVDQIDDENIDPTTTESYIFTQQATQPTLDEYIKSQQQSGFEFDNAVFLKEFRPGVAPGLAKTANTTNTPNNALYPINYNTNLRYSNPVVNPLLWRCVYNINPMEFATVGAIMPESAIISTTIQVGNTTVSVPNGPLLDSFYSQLPLDLPKFDAEGNGYVPYQGPWYDNHKTEFFLTVFLGGIFTIIFAFVLIWQLTILRDPMGYFQAKLQRARKQEKEEKVE